MSPQAKLPLRKLSGSVPLLSRWTSARDWKTSSEGPKLTTTRETTIHKNPSRNPKQTLNGMLRSLRKRQPLVSRPWPPNPHPKNLAVLIQNSTYQFEEISYLLEHLHSRMHSADSSAHHFQLLPPQMAVRPLVFLKTVVLFVAEYGCTP